MRQRRPYERDKPFGGFPPRGGRPKWNMLVGRVDGVDSVNRTVDLTWLRKVGSRTGVSIWSDAGGSNLPVPGDLCICIADEADQVYVVGFRSIDLPGRLERGEIAQSDRGERLLSSTQFGQRLWFRSNGNIELLTQRDEGLEVIPTRRVRVRAPSLFEVVGAAGRLAYGVVRRATGVPVTPDEDQAIPGVFPFVEREFNVSVNYVTLPPPVSSVGRAARFVMGTGVIDDRGMPEMSSFGSRLRMLLEVLALPQLGGISLASFEIDETGNLKLSSLYQMKVQAALMEFVSLQIDLKALQVNLGLVPIDKVLLANLFLLFYNTHVHIVPQAPAGTTVSSPPIPTAPGSAVASQTVSVSI